MIIFSSAAKWHFSSCSVALPDLELLLPADEHMSVRDICGPALAKEGLDPNFVVLYVVSDLTYFTKHAFVELKMSICSCSTVYCIIMDYQ